MYRIIYSVFAILVLSAAILCAQVTPTTLSVTATQTGQGQPSQASFSISISSPFSSTLSDVASRLTSVGVTTSNLVSVSSTPVPNTATASINGQPADSLTWTFQVTVPLSSQKATATALSNLAATIGQNGSGLSLSFTAASTQAFFQPALTCSLASLVANAHAQAQSIASAQGMTLGGIVGLSAPTVAAGATPCSLVVKYALGGQYVQSGSNTISVGVASATTTAPDQALIGIWILSGMASGLDEVTAALESAGFSGTTFTGVTTYTSYVQTDNQTMPVQSLEWTFSLTMPLANLAATLTQLTAAEQKFVTQYTGYAMEFEVQGGSVSQPASCAQATLFTQAQALAQQVASAAGVRVGSPLNLAGGVSTSYVSSAPSPAFSQLGGFGSVGFGASTVGVSGLAGPNSYCTATVQYQLW